jgi:hypothetical protein
MTTRRPRRTSAAKAEKPAQEEEYKIPQDKLEKFFTDSEPEVEPEPIVKKRVRPPKTGKIFLSQEDVKHFEEYKKYLRDEQGIKDIRHKRI